MREDIGVASRLGAGVADEEAMVDIEARRARGRRCSWRGSYAGKSSQGAYWDCR